MMWRTNVHMKVTVWWDQKAWHGSIYKSSEHLCLDHVKHAIATLQRNLFYAADILVFASTWKELYLDN